MSLKDKLLIVCVYTHGSPYESEARELQQSAARFGYAVKPIGIPDQGDWWRNVGIKPKYVLETMLEHDGPLLALDADIRILAPLDEMLSLLQTHDVAVKCRPDSCFTALFNAAVLLLRKTPDTIELVETWADRGNRHAYLHRFAEQGAFSEAMLAVQDRIRVAPLEEKFHAFARPDDPLTPPQGCVIFHRKTSRATRNSALPKHLPIAQRTTDTGVEFVTVKPRSASTHGGLPINGVAGADADSKEYLSRYGISRVWTLTPAIDSHQLADFDDAKLMVLKDLAKRFPVDTRLVISDFDAVFLRDPRVFSVGLDAADLVLAWDPQIPHAVPSLRALGLKVNAAVFDHLFPQVQREFEQLRKQLGPAAQLTSALAKVLRSPGRGANIVTLPSKAVADLSAANRETTVASTRGRLRYFHGDTSWTQPLVNGLPASQPVLT